MSPISVGTVRLASPGSVVASIPLLFGFHPDNSLVILGIGRSDSGGGHIRHGVRIDLDQIRGRERAAAQELSARLRDHEAEIAILVAFGPRAATGAKARPDHCRKLMAAFRAQLEAAPTEERVTVVDALYTCNGRWWSYMCRNNRCCPTAGTVVPAEAPPGLTTALTTRGHTIYASRAALDATLAPYPQEILARTAAAAEPLDPTWYDTDAGLADARHLMDALLERCGKPITPAAPVASAHSTASAAETTRRGLTATAAVQDTPSATDVAADVVTASSGVPAPSNHTSSASRARTAAADSGRAGRGAAVTSKVRASSSDLTDTAAADPKRADRGAVATSKARRSASGPDIPAAITDSSAVKCRSASRFDKAVPPRARTAAADSGRAGRGAAATSKVRGGSSGSDVTAAALPDAFGSDFAAPGPTSLRTAAAEPRRSARRGLAHTAAIPATRSARRVTNRVPAIGLGPGGASTPDAGAPPITDAEVAQLLIALLNWRVRDYLACAAATEDSAGRLLRLCTELARRAPHPELRLAPYALAAWAAWAIGRPSVAQCAVDRALAIDPEYKFASLIRAGLHHAIDGEGVRESAANTRRDLFGETPVVPDATDPESAPAPVPSQRSTESVPTDTDLEVP